MTLTENPDPQKKTISAGSRSPSTARRAKRTINISTEEDITDFDIEDTEGWSFEQLDAKYDELQAALEELEDDPPSDEEAIDAWDERCDRIRDLMDELEDKMDEM